MEYLVTDYTEVWAPSSVVPLVRFASSAHSLISTGIDLVGIGDLEVPKQLHERLRSFDSIVSWYGSNRTEFREAMLSMNPNCKFYAALPRDFSLHATDFFAEQVGAPLGLTPRIRALPDQRDAIVIHPFSGSKKKNWPLDRYRELASRLPFQVEWLAGPEEDLPEAHRFENLWDLACWIAGARLYIGNDSGITHLAAAVGATTLAIFGPASPKIWIPRGQNVEVIAVSDLNDLDVPFVAQVAIKLCQ